MNGVYPELEFPPAPADRPHIFINMVSTIDGKIISGERDEGVGDLGSDLDHATMRQIESAADGIMVGAATLRATPRMHYPAHVPRFLVSVSGDFPVFTRFFQDSPEIAYVISTVEGAQAMTDEVQTIGVGNGEIDWRELLRIMRQDMGIEKLLCEGGSKLNASLFELGLIDEIFLTFAAKIKLGAETPTMADGNPLPREAIQDFELLSIKQEANELFLRYRRI
ncbi:MAG: RibD family protein [Fimbriimonadaceae bacterium]|nr:RibD family protein [Fimbriimonadaceae bacterium]